ncbi:hypothetical protein L9F63_015546, partial [Diploptera punctata]
EIMILRNFTRAVRIVSGNSNKTVDCRLSRPVVFPCRRFNCELREKHLHSSIFERVQNQKTK